MKVLCVGDVMGKPGRQAARTLVPALRVEHGLDAVVMNVENAAGGFGVTPEVAEELLEAGADVLTSGNHVWDKKEIMDYLDSDRPLLRPANYPPPAPGRGRYILTLADGRKLGVLNLEGRVFMRQLDCPFRIADREIAEMARHVRCSVVDIHAETTSEKMAIGWYLDGRVSAVVGTHTHVQTADPKILPRGTAYLTDLGMTGPQAGVIGMAVPSAMARFLSQVPSRMEVATDDVALHGAIIDIDDDTGWARSILPVSRRL